MKVLIVGGKGFIGNKLAIHLSTKYDVFVCDIVDCNETNYFFVDAESPNFDELFSTEQFDFCINASGFANVPLSLKEPLLDFNANTKNVFLMLDAIRKYQKNCGFITLSSAAVYGNPQKIPIMENDDLNPISPYGYDKKLAEDICKMFSEIYGLNTTCLRLFSVYGTGIKKQLIWDVCNKYTFNDIVSLFGTGNETRDFIHVDDIVQIIDLLINDFPIGFEILNCANGEQISVKQIATYMEQIFSSGKKIVFSNENRKGDPLYWEADISKIKRLGYKQRINIYDGLRDYIKWFKQEVRS